MECSSHSQVTLDSATGVVHGSSTRNRTTHLPRKSAIRMLARILPNSTMKNIETPVKISVFHSDFQNTGSLKTRRKLVRPAQSYDGSPAVTSLKANATASPKGTAT